MTDSGFETTYFISIQTIMKTSKLLFLLFFIVTSFQIFSQEIQWAATINYDIEITNKDQFNARMATGAPDAKTYGELSKRCATANKQKNAQIWVDFKTPQEAKQILIIENNSCGNIIKVELLDEEGTGTPVYEKPVESTSSAYRLFTITLPEKSKKVKTIKIKISGASGNEEQIDAIGIIDSDVKLTFDDVIKKYNTNAPTFSKAQDVTASNFEFGFDKKNVNVLNIKKNINVLLAGLKPGESGNMGGNVNSEYDEVAPIISPDEKTLYYIRAQHPKNVTYGSSSSEDIWFSQWNTQDTAWGIAQHMANPFNTESVNKVVGITPDGNSMLVKGAYKNGKSEGLGFSFTKRILGGWSVPEKIKLKDYEEMVNGAYVGSYYANDGRTLLLSLSERSGQENDIYVSFLKDDNSWSRPINLGKTFNTIYKEDTPFLASDGVTLYFSSDRPGGLGKRDIYFSKRLDDSWQNWSTPINLGSSVNTTADDANYSIAASGYYAYMVSTRNSIGESDIVRIKLKDEIKPNPVVLVSGKVINAKTNQYVDASIIYQLLPDGKEAGIARSNPNNGDYKIVLPYGKNYSFNAGAQGYIAVSDNLDLTSVMAYQEITRNLYLYPVEVGETIRLNNIFFETAKFDLLSTSFVELDKLVKILTDNPLMEISISGHTDNVGNDAINQTLSANRAKAVVDYLVLKGIVAAHLQQAGYGKTKPVATNDTDDGRALNRRVEFTINKK
jgi:outer membrane protein OmpA-like peptidoglycan-associated protein